MKRLEDNINNPGGKKIFSPIDFLLAEEKKKIDVSALYGYKVEKGKNNAEIAQMFGVSKGAIEKANKELHEKRGGKGYFYPDDKILIPNPTKNLDKLKSTQNPKPGVKGNITETPKEKKESDENDRLQYLEKALWVGAPGAMVTYETGKKLYEIGKGIFDFFSSDKDSDDKDVKSIAGQYESQRDNKYDNTNVYSTHTDRVYGDNMCNVTSLAMSLKGFATPDSIRETLLKQLSENGFSENRINEIKNYDIEDLILFRFEQLGSNYWLEGIRRYLGQPYFTFKNTNPPHQWGYCLTEMGKLIVSDLETVYVRRPPMKQSEDNIKQHFIEEVKPKVDSGAGIIASTYLTGGHIVYLQDVHNDGIVIQDPYGLNMGEKSDYLKNSAQIGETEKQRLDQELDGVIKERLKFRSELLKELEQIHEKGSGNIPGNVGEYNFYNWSEVKSLEIGRWMIGLNDKK
jgi:hypothetical protein